jgi:hypothetical protein
MDTEGREEGREKHERGSPMSVFVKISRFYVNLDYIAVVEETEDLLIVRFGTTASNIPQVSIKKSSAEGVDLLSALHERLKK